MICVRLWGFREGWSFSGLFFMDDVGGLGGVLGGELGGQEGECECGCARDVACGA